MGETDYAEKKKKKIIACYLWLKERSVSLLQGIEPQCVSESLEINLKFTEGEMFPCQNNHLEGLCFLVSRIKINICFKCIIELCIL